MKALTLSSVLALILSLGSVACSTTVTEQDKIVQHAPLSLQLKTEGSVWGGVVMRGERGTYLATALHSENEFGLWQIDEQRTVIRVAEGLETGYHPDGVAVWDASTFVVAVEGARTVEFWRLKEGGGVELHHQMPAPFPARDVVAMDFDQDGKQDLLFAPYQGASLAVLWGKGGTEFSEPQFLQGDLSGWHPIAVDWTGNGLPDLIWSELDSGVVRIARNLGDRAFEIEALHKVQGVTPRQVAYGLIGKERRPVLAVAVEIGEVELLFPEEDGALSVERIEAPGLGYVSVAVMADGTIALGEEGRVMLLREVDGVWEKRQLDAFSMPAPIESFDVDADGHDDLVIYHSSGSNGTLIHFGPLWERAAPLAETLQ